MAVENVDPDIEYSLLSGQDKAAILLSSLGPQTTQLIFKHLRDNDVKRIIGAMSDVKGAPIWLLKKILEEFYAQINEESNLLFSENRGRDFVINVFGRREGQTIARANYRFQQWTQFFGITRFGRHQNLIQFSYQ